MSQNVTEGEAIHSDRAAEVSRGRTTPEIGGRPERYPARGIKGRASKQRDS